MSREKILITTSWISTIGNAILSVSKIIIGLFAGSLAVVGDGIDSATDVVISIVMIFTARLINRPPSKKYVFGYEKAEGIAKRAVADFIAGRTKTDDMHEVNVFWELLASCKAAGRIDLFDESAFGQTLQRAVRALIGTDPQAWATGYVCTPSRFIRSPKSPFYPGSESLPEQECDQMIQGRNADGVWEITWSWGAYEREFAIAENWWKANLVIENLLFLRAFDCIETKR